MNPFGRPLTMNEKWEIVRLHYESAYKKRFVFRLSDEEIEELYKKYVELCRTEKHYKK